MISKIKALIMSRLWFDCERETMSLERLVWDRKLPAPCDSGGSHGVYLLTSGLITWVECRWSFFQLINLPEVVVPRGRRLENESGKTFPSFFPGVSHTVCKLMHLTGYEFLTCHTPCTYIYHRCTTGSLLTTLDFSLLFSRWTRIRKYSWKKGSWWSARSSESVQTCLCCEI